MKLEELKKIIKEKIENFEFVPYFSSKFEQRPYLTKELVKSSLEDFDNYLGFQRHFVKGTSRFRIGIKLSGKYVLVVVLEMEKEHLNIVTAWKTSRKWQKAIQK
jgi:hypothetical protein